MNHMKHVVMTVCACFSVLTGEARAALTWSSCQTVTGVSNYMALSNSVYLTLSPGIPGCNASTGTSVSSVGFAIGQEGVSATNIESYLATGLTAMSTGSQVTIYYDTSTAPQCYSMVLAVHGYANQCP
jgi:hypothetical protein